MPNICHLVLRLERTIRNTFIPDVTGGHIFYDKEKLISLPNRHGGLFILVFPETAEINFEWPFSSSPQEFSCVFFNPTYFWFLKKVSMVLDVPILA